MSEPTYRVDLSNDPTEIEPCRWAARIIRLSDGEQVTGSQWGATREQAFDAAQEWIKRANGPSEPPSSVYLSEDGDILDPHEVTR